jgi:oligoendopeptidase F
MDEILDQKRSDRTAGKYRPCLRDLRAFHDHRLSHEIEQLLHEREVAGRSAWTRLIGETIAEMRFPLNRQSLTSAEALHPAQRQGRRGAQGRGQDDRGALGKHLRIFALIPNALAKEKGKEIDDKSCRGLNVLSGFIDELETRI